MIADTLPKVSLSKKRFIPSYIDLVTFVILHRGDRVFRNLSVSDVTKQIVFASSKNELCYTLTDDEQQLNGLILYTVYPRDKMLFVRQILCLDKQSLRQLIDTFRVIYPGYTLEARRFDQLVTYNKTDRLCHLLKKI